jgi:hypothetical protein
MDGDTGSGKRVEAAAKARAVEDAVSGVADKINVAKGPKSVVFVGYERES